MSRHSIRRDGVGKVKRIASLCQSARCPDRVHGDDTILYRCPDDREIIATEDAAGADVPTGDSSV